MSLMPELMDGAILFGLVAAGFSWTLKRHDGQRRLPFWVVIAIGIVAAYLGPPLFAVVKSALSFVPGMSRLTETSVIFGLWVALISLVMFETKGQPRRVPIWVGLSIALVATFAVPPLLDRVTGIYQNASLRPNVNSCTSGMLGQSAPRQVTNICDYSISVGLCMPAEENPAPCRQTITIAPGAVANFDPGEARLSYLPSNPNGLTVVACRPPNRPSRTLSVLGRGHRGVCLPAI